MNNKWLKVISTMAVTTAAGLVLISSNARADTTVTEPSAQQLVVNPVQATTTADRLNLYSNNLAQVENTQNINFPAGYTLDAVRNVHTTAAANALQNQVAYQGIYNNDYQSDPAAAQEEVDINNLTADQVAAMNQYGLSLVNKARAEFGEAPFTQNAATINQVRNLALEYQSKDESLLKGNWHDYGILQGRSENIATFQIYVDSINGLSARPFATAKGRDFADSNAVPLFSLTTMDDLRALVYYGIMGMFFNDAGDLFGHAQNFLTYNQPITTLALYPALTYSDGNGRWSNGQTFTFRLENVDMHYIWTTGDNYNPNDFSNAGTAVAPWNKNDNGNYANLDGAYLTGDGQLIATGWHAANATQGRGYRFIIALDQEGHEIARTRVKNIIRYDVQRAHNVYDAARSGFSVQLDLGTALANTSSIRLISRYSGSADGNSNYVDYDFAPVTIDRTNYANLDSVTVDNNQLHLTGWNATNQAAGKKYHYLILLNNGREVGRTLVKDGISRSDVANVYPHVDGASHSGFAVDFDLTPVNFNQRLQVISRYTDDPAGNGHYVDYWFAPLTEGNYSNQAHLDAAVLSGNRLNIAGWHANSISQFETHRFIIIYDTTANRQVAAVAAPTVARPDVQCAYPGVVNAGQSGFNLSIDRDQLQLIPGHQYAIISRYSTADSGNGGGGQYTDYWFTGQYLVGTNEAGYLDRWGLSTAADGGYDLAVSGWRVTNLEKGYHTLILYDNSQGREVARQTVTIKVVRPDVAAVYGDRYSNADQPGFAATFHLANRPVGDFTIIDRYSLTADANSDYTDVWLHLGQLK
ncbi:SEC10/PgrA surface exclusion domain-containing protein [Limosilactobacillus oris]|uniref:SEC10/PgrA surface exclusion domain-containing protein n=1 Tax=Limosilactobacillus oris TaxID=1632 RepID=UPI0024B38973|nr:SEC10/PgrA surface exclusion domain-containing protein [Limosilactobacillus oris]WHO86065.1 SEC10/PgrA surface exclusion domain-containing protein [Limosilactobacillus oris]